ncbi:MAG: cytochrome C oxidase subunit IV family protein [Nitrososphaerota archaeon]|jgi:heme/copper-type cytochrome/quinol oxidase subunit 4|nr:cytochrome C oxidase subunit IV family protein [Nitrososphaerota archaeon]MDG6919104.1 cytochrome C oxidase subunit IV family protein [Nitrososphaerota archaeon]
MREAGTIGVLVYLLLATIAEVYLSGSMVVSTTYYTVIGIIAISEATVMGGYYMGLKDEPSPVRAIALVGVIFIAVLIISMVVEYIGPSY